MFLTSNLNDPNAGLVDFKNMPKKTNRSIEQMKVFKFLSPILLMLGLAGITPLSNAAAIWDLSNDFSPNNDVTNVWQYGTIDTGSFNAFNSYSPNGYPLNVASHCNTNCTTVQDPNISKNDSGSTIVSSSFSNNAFGITAFDQAVIFGPYPSGVAAQWTATMSGIYQIDAFFQDVQDCCQDRTPYGEVLLNHVSLFGPARVGTLVANTTLDYNDTLNLNAGDTLHFVVNGGYDSTQVSATIRRVPEPTAIALFALGLFGLGFARRRQA
jgi:hypothetical protein